MDKRKITEAILSKNSAQLKEILLNAPEQESIISLIKDLRDSLGASLEINHEITDWVVNELRKVISPIIREYYVSLIKKHFFALGLNPDLGFKDGDFRFDYSTYEIFKHTFPSDIFSSFFSNKFFNTGIDTLPPEETENNNFYRAIIEEELKIPFFSLLPNIVKIRLVGLDQRMYSDYFQEIIYGVSNRTNVHVMDIFIQEFGADFLEEIFTNPKYSMIKTDIWRADLLASCGHATQCYWENDKIKLTSLGHEILNLVYSPFWHSLIDAPLGLDSIFLP